VFATVRAAGVRFSIRWFFNHHSIMALEAVKFNLFSNLYIYLFSFFIYSHSRTREVQLVCQREMLKTVPLQGNRRLGTRFQEETQNETETREKLYKQ
jgi:hypothetical protein